MGCSSSLQQNNKTPLIIDGENIISIIFNIDGGRIKMPSITLPFFRLGNLFLNCLLKREDEKYVTEHAYENPKFVEDVLRDVITFLREDEKVTFYEAEIEPVAKELSDQLTFKIFSKHEIECGNEIIFEASSLEFASMKTKLELKEMVDRGAMNTNEWRRTMNLGSTENGYVAYYAKQIIKDESSSKLSTDSSGYVTYNDVEDIWLINYIGTDTNIIIPNSITNNTFFMVSPLFF